MTMGEGGPRPSSAGARTAKDEAWGPGQEAQMVGVSSRYTKVVGSIPSQGTIGEPTNECTHNWNNILMFRALAHKKKTTQKTPYKKILGLGLAIRTFFSANIFLCHV